MASELCLCPAGDCILKNNCLRYTTKVYGRQDFFGRLPYITPSSCEYYIDDRPKEWEIRPLAAKLWRDAGMPQGRDIEFWLRAEDLLLTLKRG